MFQTTNQVSYPLVILHGKGHPFKIIPFKSLKNFGVCPHPYQPHCWWNLKVLKSQGFLGKYHQTSWSNSTFGTSKTCDQGRTHFSIG